MKNFLLLASIILFFSCNKNEVALNTDKRNNIDSITIDKLPKDRRALYNLFVTDISAIPDSSFLLVDKSKNTSNDSIYSYRKILKNEELGLFNVVEVKVFRGKSMKNVFFRTFNAENKWAEILNVHDNLYSILGEEENKKPKFDYKTMRKFNEHRLYTNRQWDTSDGCHVNFDISDNEASLGFWLSN